MTNAAKTFAEKHSLSVRQLSLLAGGTANNAGKSTLQKFLNEDLDRAAAQRIRVALGDALPGFLLLRGISPNEINSDLATFLNDGEFKPMISDRVVLPRGVQKWFGLTADPFAINLNGMSDVFISDDLKEVFERVIDAIRYQGFVAVTGDIGAGKTVLRAWIEEYVSLQPDLKLIFPETYDMQKVSPASIARAILEEFDYGKIPIDSVSRAKAVKRILKEKQPVSIAIAFDECHRLNPTTLSSLKNFLEMNSGGFRRYLGVVLFGQPAFETQLIKSREIAERLEVIEMPPFERSAVEYLTHRISLAGRRVEDLFDTDALDLIAANSATPLQLGNIANKAMIRSAEKPRESKFVLGSILRATMTFPAAARSLAAVR